MIPFIGPRGVGSECEGKERGKGGKCEGMLLECNGISVTEDTAEIGRSESSCLFLSFSCIFLKINFIYMFIDIFVFCIVSFKKR